MNQHLKTIQDLLQQNKNLSEADKEALLKSIGDADKQWSITDFKLDRTEKVKKTTAILLEETIEELEQKRKAVEAQNRELEIEGALERVRTIAMSMNKAEDMLDVCKAIAQQLEFLSVKEVRNIQTAIFYREKGTYMNYEYYAKHDKTFITETVYTNHEIAKEFAAKMLKGKGEIFVTLIKGEEKVKEWLAYQKSTNVFIDTFLETASSLNYYWFSLGPVALGISTYVALGDDELRLFKRFLNVFELAYRRYLDIEKAEVQARKAQIELALERVRARTMAMQKSEELAETSLVLFQQFKDLGETSEQISIGIFREHENIMELYSTMYGSQWKEAAKVDLDEPVVMKKIQRAWKEQNRSLVIDIAGDDLRKYNAYRKKLSNLEYKEDRWVIHIAFFSKGVLTFSTTEPYPAETLQLLERFAGVFDQTYTRFLDLQKAEAQATEARIEVALEKVRSRSLAMHKSSELEEVIMVVSEQLQQLQFRFHNASFVRYNEQQGLNFWLASPGQPQPYLIEVPFLNNPIYTRPSEALTNGIDFIADVLTPEENQEWLNHLLTYSVLKNASEEDKKYLRGTAGFARSLVLTKHIILVIGNYAAVPYTDEQNLILKRFGNVFDQAYTRFLDLQKAEAQAREAKIEAALERVRARALAMQQPEELKDVAGVLRIEMGLLGVEELETCSIYIHADNSDNAECWYALKDEKQTEKRMVSDHFALDMKDTWVGRQMLEFYNSGEKQTSIVMTGADRREWIAYCYKHSPVFTGFYGETIPDRTYHLYKFSHGAIGAAAPGDISEESWRMLTRAASVFSLAYSRFKDLSQARTDLIKLKEEKKRAEDALTELQITQKQLIQSEKMASLGELTAGIAHEIQNPLNFVNNFSDVSQELLDEMKTELEKGNNEDAMAIADDVKQNLEKILHHGKRADAIVKGMLQHSRTGSGQKELTDINNLADEYLRLAYHGLRAKDKVFNAAMKTEYDDSIGLIRIIPQDVGRVILNLITNAFYAVTEKKKIYPEGYEPVVTVSTKKQNDKVEVYVKDNGIGIPPKALDKIFQPFFTTKPTGQGTGLGLSLSYDIITKGHGGELKVETKEGEGSNFIISLPSNRN